jgi:hypothetical protein
MSTLFKGRGKKIFSIVGDFYILIFSSTSLYLLPAMEFESYNIITGCKRSTSSEWFDSVFSIMENSGIIEAFLQEDIQLDDQNLRQRRRYSSHNRSKNLWASEWGQMIISLRTSDPGSWENRKFRRRFRVPFEMFLDIVSECNLLEVFGKLRRRRKIDTEFKVLASLRILGRDVCCDKIEERLNISESHINFFFKQFLQNYANALYSRFVYIPEAIELAEVMKVYRRMGFPGCVGSMDVTHVYWDKCPEVLTFLCKGKEGKPTVSFQVVADHTKRIHHVSKPFYGATNDITITYQEFSAILWR